MQLVALCSLVVVNSPLIQAQIFSYDPQNTKTPITLDEFRGLKWACDIRSCKDFTLVQKKWDKEDPDIKTYIRRETLKIATVDVDSIEYSFYKGKFFCVIARVGNLEVFPPLKEAITAMIGEGGIRMEVNTEDGSSWACKGKTPLGKEIQIILGSKNKEREVVLNINYLGIENEFK